MIEEDMNFKDELFLDMYLIQYCSRPELTTEKRSRHPLGRAPSLSEGGGLGLAKRMMLLSIFLDFTRS